MRTINKIIVHCTATPEHQKVTVADINQWHRQRGMRCIGYHYVIYLDGSIHAGRAESEIGAHCSGQNAHSIGVCYVGGCDHALKPKDTRTLEQKTALVSLLRNLKSKYPNAKIYGHRDFSNKACPSFDAKAEYANI